jgi:hypothetical protein
MGFSHNTFSPSPSKAVTFKKYAGIKLVNQSAVNCTKTIFGTQCMSKHASLHKNHFRIYKSESEHKVPRVHYSIPPISGPFIRNGSF